VLNALRYNPGLGERQLKEIATALDKYSLWLAPLEGELAETSVENSMRHSISVYDSACISLADQGSTRLQRRPEVHEPRRRRMHQAHLDLLWALRSFVGT